MDSYHWKLPVFRIFWREFRRNSFDAAASEHSDSCRSGYTGPLNLQGGHRSWPLDEALQHRY